ncbi:MAG: magnesium transporter [Candidatus Marinimicrobia bacterium]|nr:magnesium transporter [Candidatus Neomarinimicrobiota bacterium]MCF7829103.1 magnesium transporter [Candidatus Neomarinimicrobiota bacterium]MCF7881498.1 magnesium transporter [Candidatus Neomarinimicrobiota bacterium]
MLTQEINILLDTLRRLNRRNAHANLKKILHKTHAADLATIFRYLTEPERREIFPLISDRNHAAEVLSEMDDSLRVELINQLTREQVIELFSEMATDDLADVLGLLPDDLSGEIVQLMEPESAIDLEAIMGYPEDTAGGIMIPEAFSLNEDTTASEAIEVLQQSENSEMVFYVYVVDDDNHLKGVCSLRQLLMVSPKKALKDFMITQVVSVLPETDQEEVARLVGRYNILALPVVDDENHLLGIVTVDDIIDVIREEATEDFLQMAGAGRDREILLKSTYEESKLRFPWLFATWIGGIVASMIVSSFGDLLQRVVALAAFMPIIAGMGGNIGTQSATIVIRGLATGRVNIREAGHVIFKELRVGLILGITYGIALAILVKIIYTSSGIMVGVVVGLGICAVMILAALMGAFAPIVLNKLNVDPAIATGPFVTTSIDILGLLIYFSIAMALL